MWSLSTTSSFLTSLMAQASFLSSELEGDLVSYPVHSRMSIDDTYNAAAAGNALPQLLPGQGLQTSVPSSLQYQHAHVSLSMPNLTVTVPSPERTRSLASHPHPPNSSNLVNKPMRYAPYRTSGANSDNSSIVSSSRHHSPHERVTSSSDYTDAMSLHANRKLSMLESRMNELESQFSGISADELLKAVQFYRRVSKILTFFLLLTPS